MNPDRERVFRRDRLADDEPLPEVSSVHKGQVASIQSFGIFVRIDGFRKQGLVHVSQISNERVETEDIPKIVEVGEQIWIKVIGITDDRKISLAMKYVNQTTGEDLDPNNVELMQTQQRRKRPPPEKQKIELGAILPTKCNRCGATGHASNECYNTSGKQYQLIPEPKNNDSEPAQQSSVPVGSVSSLKQALKILAQQKGEKSSDSSSEESDTRKRKHKHKKHKHKHEHKHKHKHKKHKKEHSD